MNKKEIVCYNTDASRLLGRTEKVLFPESAEEVKEIVKTSSQDIVPRGAGTGFVGGAIPNDSIVVDLGKMTKVSSFNPSKRTVHVEAGVTIKELNEKLLAVNFEFPIVPSNNGISTIGGMIATNASGNRSMRYGFMKDWIDEIEFVNGKSELQKTSKSEISEICGMEGITGIITGATLRILPKIKRTASVFQTDNIEEFFSVARKVKQEKEVTMAAFFSREVSKILGFPESYNMIIEFDSTRGKITGEEYEKLLDIKEKAYNKVFSEGYYNSENPKLFFDEIKEFVLFLEKNKIPYFGDFGTGVVYPFFKDSEKNKRALVIDLIKKLKLKLGRYGFGLTKKDLVDSFEAKIIQRVKLRHDPNQRFNKRKVIDVDLSQIKSDREFVSKSEPIYEKSVHEKPIQIREPREPKQIAREIPRPITKDIPVVKPEKSVIVNEIKREMISNAQKNVQKSPEQRMNELIKKAEKADEEIKAIIEKEEIEERLEDYRETFESELEDEKRKQVEDFAKQVPREAIEKQENNQSIIEHNVSSRFAADAASKKPAVDMKTINSIMTNNRNNAPQSHEIASESSITYPKNEKRMIMSQEEQDTINKILGNRYKKSEEEK